MKIFSLVLSMIANILLLESAEAQERIYSNSQLFAEARQSLRSKNYRRAESFIFALIQKNSDQYRSNQVLRQDLNNALIMARQNKGPQSGGTWDDGFLTYSEQLLSDAPRNSITFMSGTYTNSTGQKYQINRVGKDIWWLSMTRDKRWTSVMKGEITGNFVVGKWTFIPSNNGYSHGTIKLKIVGPGTFTVEEVSGGIQAIGDMRRGASWSLE